MIGPAVRVLDRDVPLAYLEDTPGLLVMVFHRAEIDREDPEAAIATLEQLSSSALLSERHALSVVYMVEGFDDDPRELYEVPQCRAFFAKLTARWGYWLHFLAPCAELHQTLVALHVPVSVIRRDAARVGTRYDAGVSEAFCARLRAACDALHRRHAISPALAARVRAEADRALRVID